MMKKYVKMLGLAAVAVTAVMAFAGASSASAAMAKICSTASVGGASCGTNDGTVYHGTVEGHLTPEKTAKLTSGFATVNCSPSTVHGEITNGATGTGFIDGLTFGTGGGSTGCSSNIGACTAATSTAAPTNQWGVTVNWNAAGSDGTMEVENVGGSFTCGGITCIYGKAKVGTSGEITVTGGKGTGEEEMAEVDATSVPLEKKAGSNALCSANGTWSGQYTLTSPTTLFVTEA